MGGIFNVYTILALGLLVLFLVRLYGVLGWRTERDHRRSSFVSVEARSIEAEEGPDSPDLVKGEEKERLSGEDRWGEYARWGSGIASVFDRIQRVDREFLPESFLDGARQAYNMIVRGFYSRNLSLLKDLVSPEVYETFVGEMRTDGLVEDVIPEVKDAHVIDGWLEGWTAFLTVRFESYLGIRSRPSGEKDSEGKDRKTVDLWTFSRDLSAGDPNWLLVSTETA